MRRDRPGVLTVLVQGDMLFVKTDSKLLDWMEQGYCSLINKLHPEPTLLQPTGQFIMMAAASVPIAAQSDPMDNPPPYQP